MTWILLRILLFVTLPALGILSSSFVVDAEAQGTPEVVLAPDPSAATTLGERAWALLLAGESQRALAICKDLSGPVDARCIVVQLTASNATEGSLRESEEALASARDSLVAILARAKRHHLERRFEDAAAGFADVSARYSAMGDSISALVCLEERATALQDAGSTTESAIEFHRVLEWSRSLGRPLEETSANYGIAYTAVASGHTALARSHAEAVLTYSRASTPPLWEWIGHAEYLLHVVERDHLRPSAEDHLQKAFEAYRNSRNQSRQAACLRNLASLHGEKGEFPRMIDFLRRAESLARAAGDLREASFCLEHRGSVEFGLGNIENAADQWRGALQLGGHLWAPEWRMTCLARLSQAELKLGRTRPAQSSMLRALALADSLVSGRSRSGLLVEAGRFFRDSGEDDRAIRLFQDAANEAREWELPRVEASALVELGRSHLEFGDIEAADTAFARAKQVAGQSGHIEFDAPVLEGQARSARAQGDLERSWNHLVAAMDIAEATRVRSRSRSEFGQRALVRSRSIYEEAVDVAHEHLRLSGRDAWRTRAFEAAQRAKARAFADLLAETHADLAPLSVFVGSVAARELQTRIARLLVAETNGNSEARKEIEFLRDELALLEAREREANPRYAEVVYPKPASVEEVQSTLRPGELLLDYQLGEDASYVFAIAADRARLVRLPKRDSIEVAVESWLPLLWDYNMLGRDARFYAGPASRVYSLLLEPIDDWAEEYSVLTVSPDGILHHVPFGALVRSDRPEQNFADLDYLALAHDVGYVPSATVLARQRMLRAKITEPPGTVRDLLLIGAPADTRQEPTPLVRAVIGERPLHSAWLAEEAQSLTSIGLPGGMTALLGRDATHAGLQEELASHSYRYIHFAAHGVYNARRPRFSGLVLSPGLEDGDDGFLTVDDVCGLSLPCRQVVLSACSSALGEDVEGEGVTGLTRAFLYAGAQSVVAALWDVAGVTTASLMNRMYESLLHSDRSELASLCQAQRALIREGTSASGLDTAHPFCWAGFLHISDGR